MNLLRNATFLFVCLIIMVICSVILSIGEYSIAQIIAAQPDIDFTHWYSIYTFLPTMRTILGYGLNFIMAFVVLSMFISSAIERQSVSSYVLNAILGILVSSLLMWLTAGTITAMVTMFVGTGYITFPELPTWMFTYFHEILIINLIAGLGSFVFVKATGVTTT